MEYYRKILKEKLYLLAKTLAVLAIGFLISGAIMLLGGYSPIRAYKALLTSSILTTDVYYVATTLAFATPVMLTAITFAIGVKAGVFNIGAEGQMYLGALGAIIIASMKMPGPLYIPLALMLGSIFGALWGAIAGVLKAYRGVNEVVSTIMLNWIAFWITKYLIVYYFSNPEQQEKSIYAPESGRLPIIIKGTELTASFILALVTTLVTYILLWNTVLGYEIRATGLNPKAAKYGGISPERAIVWSFLIGGVAAGLAGVCEYIGRHPYAVPVDLQTLVGKGFEGITVSLIGANHPIGIIFASIFIGALEAGNAAMQIEAGVPKEVVSVVQGVIIMTLAIPGLLRFIRSKLSRRGGAS